MEIYGEHSIYLLNEMKIEHRNVKRNLIVCSISIS